MNPRASDRVRGFQDTIIVVGDVRVALKLGATLEAEIIIEFNIVGENLVYSLSSLVKRVILLMLPEPAKFTGVMLTL